MAQHDYVLENANGATYRADGNALFDAMATLNSGATAPTTTFANMWWADTSTNILKRRNNANTAWVDAFDMVTGLPSGLGTTDNVTFGITTVTQLLSKSIGAAGSPTVSFDSDGAGSGTGAYGSNTGTADWVALSANGVEVFRQTDVKETARVFDGTWTPTISAITNVAATVAYLCNYSKNGDITTVSGFLEIDPTATGSVQVELTLPIASTFASFVNASGTFNSGTGAILGSVRADSAANKLELLGNSTTTANTLCTFVATYRNL